MVWGIGSSKYSAIISNGIEILAGEAKPYIFKAHQDIFYTFRLQHLHEPVHARNLFH
jgi:hypothetical protein